MTRFDKGQEPHNKKSLQETIQRLKDIGISFLEETVVGFSKKAVFLDPELGEYRASPRDVLVHGRRHPARNKEELKRKLREKNRYTVERAQERMPVGVRIKPETYEAFHRKCVLIDDERGEFWCSPKEVAKAGKSLHPGNKAYNDGKFSENHERTIAIAKNGIRKLLQKLKEGGGDPLDHFRKISALGRDVMEQRYGHRSAFAVPEFRNKSKETCLERYGLEFFPVGTVQESRGEVEIREWVESLGLKTEKLVDSGFELDVYVPSLKIGIEFNGVYWHSDKYKEKSYHAAKTAFFYKKGIRVIHVFECFWEHRREQVKSFLRSALGANQQRIGARKCKFREIPVSEANAFCEENHIAGLYPETVWNIGVLYRGELIGCAQFGVETLSCGASRTRLERLCFTPGLSVSGAVAEISRMAADFSGTDIVCAVDLAISQGEEYKTAGWAQEGVSLPDYFYSNQRAEFISKEDGEKVGRDLLQRTENTEPPRTGGLFKIWDCGKIEMIFRTKKIFTEIPS